jgi:hypothetical protein
MGEPQDMMSVCSRYNAFANMCYLVESNWSYYHASGEAGVAAEINMASLRRYREEMRFGALTVYMPMHVFRKVYETEIWPKNSLLKQERSNTSDEWDRIRTEVIANRSDIYTPSSF